VSLRLILCTWIVLSFAHLDLQQKTLVERSFWGFFAFFVLNYHSITKINPKTIKNFHLVEILQWFMKWFFSTMTTLLLYLNDLRVEFNRKPRKSELETLINLHFALLISLLSPATSFARLYFMRQMRLCRRPWLENMWLQDFKNKEHLSNFQIRNSF
jgi:hypothetical protein